MGLADVLALRSLVAAAEQNNDGLAAPGVIKSVSGTVVDAKFADRTPHRFGVAKVSSGNPADPAKRSASGRADRSGRQASR
jgi:hypothetical protein